MTVTLELVLYVIAVVLILLGAFGASVKWVSLAWLGVALAVFTFGVLPGF